MNIAFPFHPDTSGRTASANANQHIQDLIEQVLFTSPGERVNRPSFGSGLLSQVFAPISDASAAALQLGIQAALQQQLSDLIQLNAVLVTAQDSTVVVTVKYVVRLTQQSASATFSQEL